MGAWGTDSCANDNCWDCLEAENIHKMDQKEADASLDRAFIRGGGEDRQTRLGVVIWVLRQGLKVGKEFLDMALALTSELAADKGYLEEWTNPEKRKASLEEEAAEIKTALARGCKGVKKHTRGLFENIAGKDHPPSEDWKTLAAAVSKWADTVEWILLQTGIVGGIPGHMRKTLGEETQKIRDIAAG